MMRVCRESDRKEGESQSGRKDENKMVSKRERTVEIKKERQSSGKFESVRQKGRSKSVFPKG